MTYWFRLFVLAVFAIPTHGYSNQTNIKVLLKEFGGDSVETIPFSSTHGIMIDTKETGRPKRSYFFKNSVSISIKDGSVFLNSKPINTNHPIRINAFDGHIKHDHEDYLGTFYLVFNDKIIYLINRVELEDYIYSVLRSESWPGWPLEVNKVFAIACRSYVIKKVLESRNSKKPFHIKNTNHHQTYRGVRQNHIHKQAVDETAGIFLGYNQQPIAAMFDCCCGGVVTANIDGKACGVDFKKAPYLARKEVCTFCKKCKIYNWGFELPLSEFEHRFATLVPGLKELTNITVAQQDKAGLNHRLSLHCGNKVEIVEDKKLYKLFKEVKSSAYTITKKKGSLVIKGRGYGHHLGLCQWGAWQMVKSGWHHKRILHFYYPGTTFMQLAHDAVPEK